MVTHDVAADPTTGRQILPRRVTICGRCTEAVRSLATFLANAGIASVWPSGAKVTHSAALGSDAIVFFLEACGFDNELSYLELLSSFRGAPPLIVVVSEATERLLLASGALLPPSTVLRPSTPVALIGQAIAAAVVRARLMRSSANTSGRDILSDSKFDQLLPAPLRAVSQEYWTPVSVIDFAADWIEELRIESVVDIGSGVGKFCIIAAQFTRTCSFVGIEHRRHLVEISRELSVVVELQDRVRIIEGRFGETELPVAQCYYLFNPFEENLCGASDALDDCVELSSVRFNNDLRAYRRLVAALPIGSYVMTYNGVGGRVPGSLEQLRVERSLPAFLRLFQKVRRSRY